MPLISTWSDDSRSCCEVVIGREGTETERLPVPVNHGTRQENGDEDNHIWRVNSCL